MPLIAMNLSEIVRRRLAKRASMERTRSLDGALQGRRAEVFAIKRDVFGKIFDSVLMTPRDCDVAASGRLKCR